MDLTKFESFGDWRTAGDEIVNGVLVQDLKGRVLLQFRDDWPDIVDGGKWSLFGGGVEDGEPLEASTIREFFEETGLSLAGTVALTAPILQDFTFEVGNDM